MDITEQGIGRDGECMRKMETEQFVAEQQKRQEQIEELLQNALPQEVSYQKTICDAMAYSLLAGGKRLRPMLIMESYRLFGGKDVAEIAPFMAAIEMIHTYSLVHDDLPAMDNDAYRRGRKTTHIVYGEDMGILAGDALLNYAYETAIRGVYTAGTAESGLRALQILADKAGIYGMVGGQVVDVELTGQVMDEERLQFIYQLKTGALLEAALMMGATLAGASEEEIARMEQIGRNVGMAFQIQDDILDLVSTTEQLGKPVHSDEKNDKTTYVTLHGFAQAKEMVEQYSREALDLLGECAVSNDFLNALITALIKRKK